NIERQNHAPPPPRTPKNWRSARRPKRPRRRRLPRRRQTSRPPQALTQHFPPPAGQSSNQAFPRVPHPALLRVRNFRSSPPIPPSQLLRFSDDTNFLTTCRL